MTNRDSEPRPPVDIVTAQASPAPGRLRRRAIAGAVCAALGLAAGSAAGWLGLPELLYARRDQPLDFSHQAHVEAAGLSCEDCHAFGADGSFGGIPATASCAGCHAERQGESEAERILVEDYVATGREIPWLVYSRQPDNVYFSHAPHVRRAAIECRRCHGDRGTSAATAAYEFNRISTYSRAIWGPRIGGGGPDEWDSMKMSACVKCHAERGVRDHCLMCHK